VVPLSVFGVFFHFGPLLLQHLKGRGEKTFDDAVVSSPVFEVPIFRFLVLLSRNHPMTIFFRE